MRGNKRQPLGRAVTICLAGAGLFFVLRFYFVSLGWHVVSEVTLHVAVAFLVALIVIVALEYNAHQQTHREVMDFVALVAEQGFQALFRGLPDSLFAELSALMRSEVVRVDCRYVITFKEGDPKLGPNHALLRRETAFIARNISDHESEYSLDSSNLSETKINGETVVLGAKQLELRESGPAMFSHSVLLPPNGSASIYLSGEENVSLGAGRFSFVLGTPTVGITIFIRNECPKLLTDLRVLMIHGSRMELRQDKQGMYRFDRAILPGNGFEVFWNQEIEVAV